MTKYIKVFAICLLVNKIDGLNSYQSIVNSDGHPILRTAIDESDASLQAVSEPEAEPSWVGDLRTRIERLVLQHGYDAAKPRIKKTVEVERDGESAITYEYKRKDPLRSIVIDPEKNTWMEDVEKLVVAVLDSYAKDQIEKQLKPAIKVIEKEKGIKISDIDGNVEVKIKQVEPKSKKMLRKPHHSNNENQYWRDVTAIYE